MVTQVQQAQEAARPGGRFQITEAHAAASHAGRSYIRFQRAAVLRPLAPVHASAAGDAGGVLEASAGWQQLVLRKLNCARAWRHSAGCNAR